MRKVPISNESLIIRAKGKLMAGHNDNSVTMEAKLKILVLSLEARLGRLPTEDELRSFIHGDYETRTKIWNSEVK